MPNWNDILGEINIQPSQADSIRRKYIKQLSDYTKRNTIVYYSGWLQKSHLAQHGVRFDINDLDKTGFMSTIHGLDRTKGLDLILHTPGGSIAATESIVDYLKAMFANDVRAIVPQIAMSAGTMIACSCKEIIMGKHSNLGPVDPQIMGIPTHGIIEEFERAKKEIKNDPNLIDVWRPILSKYNPTLIGECQKAIAWSESIVSTWLKSNMFENDPNKDAIVETILSEIGSHALTLSHERHLHIDILKNKLKLKIFCLEDDSTLQDLVLSVHHALNITLSHTAATKIIENNLGKANIQQANINHQIPI